MCCDNIIYYIMHVSVMAIIFCIIFTCSEKITKEIKEKKPRINQNHQIEQNKIAKESEEREKQLKIIIASKIKTFEESIKKEPDYQELFINVFDIKAILKWTTYNVPEPFKIFSNNNNETYISFYRDKQDALSGEATKNYLNYATLNYYETCYGCVCVVVE